jgi:hypothetical protein
MPYTVTLARHFLKTDFYAVALALNIIFVLVKLYYDLALTSNTFIWHGRKSASKELTGEDQVHCGGQMQHLSF